MLISAALVIPLIIVLDHVPAKGARVTSSPGVPTALRQIRSATSAYVLREGKSPSSLEDLVGIDVPTAEGQPTNFSNAMLEQQLGAKVSTINYFPDFSVLDHGQVNTDDIVLAYIPDSEDTQYCYVLYRGYRGRRTKGTKWVGAERMEVARVHQKIEWLTAYKNAVESNLPPPSTPMPR